MHRSIKLKDLQPNPYRRFASYKIKREKVDALKQSFADTEWWENIVVRSAPEQPGKYEIAYGHHRLIALREQYGEGAELNFIVQPIDKERMLLIMANENLEEWGSDVTITMETIKSLLHLVADDSDITLPDSDPTARPTDIRCAPSAKRRTTKSELSGENPHPYTIRTVADYLGWGYETVRTAVNGLEAIEHGVITVRQLQGKKVHDAREIIAEGLRELKATASVSAARTMAAAVDAEQKATRTRADKVRKTVKTKQKKTAAVTKPPVYTGNDMDDDISFVTQAIHDLTDDPAVADSLDRIEKNAVLFNSKRLRLLGNAFGTAIKWAEDETTRFVPSGNVVSIGGKR